MVDTVETRELIRSSLKNAAIYRFLADESVDPVQIHDFERLQEVQTEIAMRLSKSISSDIAEHRIGRFSISMALFKLATKVFNSARISGFLRGHFRRTLSTSSDEFLRRDLRSEAVESMDLLNRLSQETTSEGEHVEHGSLATRSGALRAAVLGLNDGLVSNTTLTLGVAAGASDPGIVALAGVAGLVGGALSMAAGEYVSVVSQREFNENLVRWERVELLLWHEEEEAELVEILQAKGLSLDESKSAATRIMSNPDTALDMHVREELGIDLDDLGGSPTVAAISSLVAFAGGAFVPLLPYLIGLGGNTSTIISACASAFALLAVGGSLGWLSGSGKIYGALRMLAVGLVAGAITYGLGLLVGQQIG